MATMTISTICLVIVAVEFMAIRRNLELLRKLERIEYDLDELKKLVHHRTRSIQS